MHIGFSSMNMPQDPEPTVLAKALAGRRAAMSILLPSFKEARN